MAFWSDKKLKQKLYDVISPADPSKVDVSGYRLSVGEKVFITNDFGKKQEATAIDLSVGEGFEIPAGQFALISTKEKVCVPKDALGLISMRARTKFKGLINVSGFHVDPGYSDTLVFAVFNAGPKAICISKNEDIFLIWFADLDQKNEVSKNGGGLNGNITSDLINCLNMQVESTPVLSNKLKELQANQKSLLTWGIPIASVLGTVAFSIITWAAYSIHNLDGQARFFDSEISHQKTTFNASIEKLEAQNDILRRQLEQSTVNDKLVDYEKKLNDQNQLIRSLNLRLKNLETPATIEKRPSS